ncbi:MAG: zinc ribbon domain-containing protein [Desulfuromonas sp.]|nr:MAG: zinc ribbon domain-containing protein [Desulfuromonas sp.]
MPIFEYLCDDCGQKIEKIQAQPAEQITCPSCDRKATRVVSMTSAPAGGTGTNCPTPSGSGFG